MVRTIRENRFVKIVRVLPMLYILEPFLSSLRETLVLLGLTLSSASIEAKYTAYLDDVSVLVTSSAEIVEVSKEIRRYAVASGAKINYKKSIVLRLGSWKSCALSGSFSWIDGQTAPDTLRLVHYQSPAGEEYVRGTGKIICYDRSMATKEALLKGLGQGVRLVHLLWSFIVSQCFLSSVLSYVTWKGFCSSLFGASGHLWCVGSFVSFIHPKAAPKYRTWRRAAIFCVSVS